MKRICGSLVLLAFVPILPSEFARPNLSLAGKQEPKKVEAKQIPLETMYSTSRQKGLKVLDQGVGDEGFPVQMRELYQVATGIGASNVFLARGDDITAAGQATWEVFTAGHRVDEPVFMRRRSKSRDFWLVAYFGVSGSGPVAWRVKSAEIKNKQVKLTYAKAYEGEPRTHDIHPYFFWVPMGQLEPGSYTLEIFDVQRKQVTLSRVVVIPDK